MMRKLNHIFVDHDRRPVLPGCGVSTPRAEFADHPMLKTSSRNGGHAENLTSDQRNWDSRNITGISASVILVKPGVLADPSTRANTTDRRTVPQNTDFEMNTNEHT